VTGTCPLGCGPLALDETPLRDNRLGLPYTVTVAWCGVCGLGVTVNPPSRAELVRLYEQSYVSGPGRIPRAGGVARAWHAVNGSLPLTDRVRAGPVLDVGCGTGEALVALRERGLEVAGLEPNAAAAAVARSYGLEVIEEPIEEAELPEGRFGAVLLSQVLEHVEDPKLVLRRVRPALRPGGTVYVVVPNARSLWRSLFGPHWIHWHVPFHLYHYTEPALRKLLAQCGLKPRRVGDVTSGEWLLMHLQARRNARRGRFVLHSSGRRYAARLLLAPAGRLSDALRRGDAIVAEAQ
jgi:SAM-dependent methyltransferase